MSDVLPHGSIESRHWAPTSSALCLLLALFFSISKIARGQNVLTYHNDNARSGEYLQERLLSPASVNRNSFGKLFVIQVDGKVDAEPLYMRHISIPGQGIHNVLFVATENDSVYAFDAASGATLWHARLLEAGETPSDARDCSQVVPIIGITSTPVIDPARGPHGTIFVVAMSKNQHGRYFQRLHALDLTTGKEEFGGPVDVHAEYPGTGAGSRDGKVLFDPKQYEERASLLLLNHIVYTAWASHCDNGPYTGWVIGYNERNLHQSSVLDFTPNGTMGSVWQSGAGTAAGPRGNIYFLAANGTFDTTVNAAGFPVRGDFGNAFMKLSTAGSALKVADYFAMYNVTHENDTDEDLGSGGALVLPPMTDAAGRLRYLAVGAGKDRNIYLVDRNDLGKFDPHKNNVYQELARALGGREFAMPAYFDGKLYYGAVNDHLREFQFRHARLLPNPVSLTPEEFVYPGTTPSVSADGSANGIVWAAENGDPAVLHAYDANNLSHELYNSNQAGSRDHFGEGNKFITPMIADGRVYVGTTNGIGVFGLLSEARKPHQ